jgi:hypothetical protein
MQILRKKCNNKVNPNCYRKPIFLNCYRKPIFLNCYRKPIFLNCYRKPIFLNCYRKPIFLNCSCFKTAHISQGRDSAKPKGKANRCVCFQHERQNWILQPEMLTPYGTHLLLPFKHAFCIASTVYWRNSWASSWFPKRKCLAIPAAWR